MPATIELNSPVALKEMVEQSAVTAISIGHYKLGTIVMQLPRIIGYTVFLLMAGNLSAETVMIEATQDNALYEDP